VETVKKREGQTSPALGPLGPRGGSANRRLSTSTDDLLELLRRQPEPLTLAALVELTPLHANTVREHLNTLVRIGLAARSRAEATGRGRPAWLYRATSALSEGSEYAGLAAALSSAIARTSPDPRTDATLAGEEWGRDLARNRGAAATTPEAARDRAVELLDDLGFEPRQDADAPSAVRLTRCPLLDAARRNPRIVCSVHLGVLRGVLTEYGADAAGSDLVPFAEPGACLLVVPPVEN
jgi:predicted ArsR family transcriptional regulator